ncbi:MAG: glycosyltransferase family 4 protein [Phycisphaeraceae bacterium]
MKDLGSCASLRVAVSYNFFPHYRRPVFEALHRHGRHKYVLYGDTVDVENVGIEPWVPTDIPFVKAPCHWIRWPVLVQWKNLSLALSRRFDAIIFMGSMYWPTTWVGAVLARLTGKRVLFWTHGWIRPESGFKGFLRRSFYHLAHGLLVYGHVAKIIGINSGFDHRKIHVIYNSLDYDKHLEVRQSLTEADVMQTRQELFGDCARPMLICTTRLTAVRRLDLLLDAMALLKKQDHEADLLLVGDGPERPRLEEQAKRLGLRVHFYGACYDETVLGRLIWASNLCVAPGKVGLSAMHALTFGVPVITHDDADNQMPEWEAILPGVNGGLFKLGDTADIANQINRWTQSPLPQPAMRRRCCHIIDLLWNPRVQQQIIERAINGHPANDLFAPSLR